MLPRIVNVKYLQNHRLELSFNTGEVGVIDFQPDLAKFHGVLSPLRDVAFFAKVQIDSESGTLVWPGDIDLDPDVLYSRATSAPLPEFASAVLRH
jgi:hypothetical protein